MDALQITLTSGTVLGSLGLILKWLMNSYFKNQKELEEERRQTQNNQVSTLKESLAQSKADLKQFDNRLNEFSLTLTKHTIKMENVEKAIEHTNKEFQRVAIQLEDRYKALEGAELIKVSDNTFILKARK